jgi:hypothetical protein
MLPDLRLVFAAIAVTILLVMKLGSNIVSISPEPAIGAADLVRRPFVPQALPDNPDRRLLQTLAVSRRLDELHRLLDLPTGRVSSYADPSSDGRSGTTTTAADPQASGDPPPSNPLLAPPQQETTQETNDAAPTPAMRNDVVITTTPPEPEATGSIPADQPATAASPNETNTPATSASALNPDATATRIANVTADSPDTAQVPTPIAKPAIALRPLPVTASSKSATAHPTVRRKVVRRIVARAAPTPPKDPNFNNPFGSLFGERPPDGPR